MPLTGFPRPPGKVTTRSLVALESRGLNSGPCSPDKCVLLSPRSPDTTVPLPLGPSSTSSSACNPLPASLAPGLSLPHTSPHTATYTRVHTHASASLVSPHLRQTHLPPRRKLLTRSWCVAQQSRITPPPVRTLNQSHRRSPSCKGMSHIPSLGAAGRGIFWRPGPHLAQAPASSSGAASKAPRALA